MNTENGPGHEQVMYSLNTPRVDASESHMPSSGMSGYNPLTPVHTRTEFSSPMLGNPPRISSHLATVGYTFKLLYYHLVLITNLPDRPPAQKVNIRNGKAQKLHRRGPRHYYASHYYKVWLKA